MEVITMKLEDLIKPEKNVRIHTKQQLREFQRSVEMFGQIRPIVVDESNVILAGSGLYDTLTIMGKKTAEVYRYNNLTENQKRKLMIADNKIFSLGIDNLDTLNSLLEDLNGDLDIPGFDEEILKQMVADASEVTEKLSEYGSLDDEEIRNIRERAEKRENYMHKEASGFEEHQQLAGTLEASAYPEDITDNEEHTDISKFVICQNCGEKIWL